MNVLVIGSGGREHALAWKIKQSPKLNKLFIAPGNAGTEECGTNVNIGVSDFEKIKELVIDKNISLVIVGPEVPLVEGIHDFFLNDDQLKNVNVIGPVQQAAMLEGSKDFAKDFMAKYNIPTAAYQTFTSDTLNDGVEFLKTLKAPYVLKADGLAAGKGVVILDSITEAEAELRAMLSKQKFGQASAKVVIEEFLTGIELSVFVITDGKSYKILPVAKDYKRIGEGDTGLNTGGMGSISHVPFADNELMQKIEKRVIKPTINGLISENINYKGFIFFGLINVEDNPYVIEYNARMGDPESESVIPRIKNDFLEVLIACAENRLEEATIEIDERQTAAIMLVSGGYPGFYENGKIITGLENDYDAVIFHAGTKKDENGNIVTNGGRVLAINAYGETMQQALDKSYKIAEQINFEGKYYRKDLGNDLK